MTGAILVAEESAQPGLRMETRLGVEQSISLERKLWRASLLIGLCIAGLAASIIIPSYAAYRHAVGDVASFERFRLVLNASDLISAERAPSNIVMSRSLTDDNSLARQNLIEARQATDAALAQIAALGKTRTTSEDLGQLTAVVAETVSRITAARREVDRISALPLNARTLPDVQTAISGMIDVADLIHRAILLEIEASAATRPLLTAYESVCHMLSDLREYGGRIASQVMAPVIVREPMPLSNRVDSARSHGRLLQLQQLVYAQRYLLGSEAEVTALFPNGRQNYFEKNFALLDTVIVEGRESGRYTISAEEFTQRHVAALKPIERVRAAFVDRTVRHFHAERNTALNRLVWVSAATLGALLVLASLMQTIRVTILRPLLVASETVIKLAERGSDVPAPAPGPLREMRHLFAALSSLTARLREREELTAALKREADRDPLTGLWNRRSLDRFVLAAAKDDEGSDVCLILVDIDHFKQINDTHGHLAGDEVLRQCAHLLQSLLRSSDVVVRFGGEEFAILLRNEELAAAARIANSLQAAVENFHVRIPDSTVVVRITASFGVAYGSLGPEGWEKLVKDADAGLYRAKGEGRNRVCIA